MKPDVRVFADVNELSLRAAEAAVRTINESVQTNGTFPLSSRAGARREPSTACFLRSFETRSHGQKCTFSGETSVTCRLAIHTVTTAWPGRLCWMPSRVRLAMCILCRRNCLTPT